jgi:hypothetical protein
MSPASLGLGRELATAMSALLADCTAHWGVVSDSNERLTGLSFGDYKTRLRQSTEAKLQEYMCNPSPRRSDDATGGFQIAATVAPPGTGKSRLLDDAMRMPLESRQFRHFLRLAITFSGNSSGTHRYPISVRLLRQFFCAFVPPDRLLDAIDEMLVERFNGMGEDDVSLDVLNAIEALYFAQRGGTLGRTVLMVDEISKAKFADLGDADELLHEQAAYRIIAALVDRAVIWNEFGRRGAVITGLSCVDRQSDLLWLPLGTFDIWCGETQAAIAREAICLGLLQPGQCVDERVWSLLVAAGGRPREICVILDHFRKWRVNLVNPMQFELFRAQCREQRSAVLPRYLLPSMHSIPFRAFDTDKAETQFALDVADLGLLNADLVVDVVDTGVVPAVSLSYINSSVVNDSLCQSMTCLVDATAFCTLDGSGKDFERAWALLALSHLLLQHCVRVSADALDFWPMATDGRRLGGPERPTTTTIDVFEEASRLDALFGALHPTRVHNKPLVARKIKFVSEESPTFAIWDDLWVPQVRVGVRQELGWAMATYDVEWRASTIVYFSKRSVAVVDLMLLVGDAHGEGDAQPHVYMFQCMSSRLTQRSVQTVASKLETQLELLFSDKFANHVLRRAGIASVEQVTLCIGALKFAARVDATKLTAPFGVVLFDASDFGALGGAAFATTRFFRHLSKLMKMK